MKFQKDIVLITGSSRGIGKGIAKAFAEEGATVIINGISEEHVNCTVSEFKETGKKAIGCVFDTSDSISTKAQVKRISETVGKITVLVNNAGISPKRNNKKIMFQDMTYDEWSRTVDVNLNGVFNCCQGVITDMMEMKRGKIINISSAFARYYTDFSAAHYIATKTAVLGLTRAIAGEAAPYGINCNAIAPGRTWTDMTRVQPEEVNQAFMDTVPMGRFAEIEELAKVVLFLASEDAAYINGATLDVNGGVCMV